MPEKERRPTVWERLEEEWHARLRGARSAQPLVEPTPEEAKNGWTAETLTAYLAERQASQALKADTDSLLRHVQRKRTSYHPHRWRR